MPREKWKLTQQAIDAEPQIDCWGDEDLTLGYSLLRALAESDHTLVEIEPGVWRQTAPYGSNSGPGGAWVQTSPHVGNSGPGW